MDKTARPISPTYLQPNHPTALPVPAVIPLNDANHNIAQNTMLCQAPPVAIRIRGQGGRDFIEAEDSDTYAPGSITLNEIPAESMGTAFLIDRNATISAALTRPKGTWIRILTTQLKWHVLIHV
jgi:hypothetical protein